VRLPLTRHLRRALLWSLPAVAALAAFAAVRVAWDGAWVPLAAEALAAGRLHDAEALLAGRSDPAARTGTALARVLRDGAGPEALAPPIDLEPFRVPVLLEQALRRGDFEAARRLAAAVRGHGVEGAPAYLAAALLELGRYDEARAVPAGEGGLAGEVSEVLALRAAGARTLVRDRQGRLVGTVGDDGTFRPGSMETATWIPAEPVAAAAARVPDAPGLRLTLDESLSALALQALGPERGTIVLLDAATGAVRAAVSDPRTRAGGGPAAWTERREPASIAKLITTTAALRAGRDPDAEIARMTCLGHATYGGGQLWCSGPGGALSGLGHALAISCNVAFANLGLEIGAARLVEEHRRYGFADGAGGPDGAGRVKSTPEGDRQLADLAVGLEVTDITPVHAARMAAVFADGRLPAATVLAARDGVLGRTPRALPLEPGPRILDPGWLPMLARAMEAVTEPGGTAAGLDPPGFPVAMKTGTAAEPGAGYHVNYIGVGPLPHPRLAFCVRLTHGGSSPDITRRAREVLSRLLLLLDGAA
jgi:hypothetical protein